LDNATIFYFLQDGTVIPVHEQPDADLHAPAYGAPSAGVDASADSSTEPEVPEVVHIDARSEPAAGDVQHSNDVKHASSVGADEELHTDAPHDSTASSRPAAAAVDQPVVSQAPAAFLGDADDAQPPAAARSDSAASSAGDELPTLDETEQPRVRELPPNSKVLAAELAKLVAVIQRTRDARAAEAGDGAIAHTADIPSAVAKSGVLRGVPTETARRLGALVGHGVSRVVDRHHPNPRGWREEQEDDDDSSAADDSASSDAGAPSSDGARSSTQGQQPAKPALGRRAKAHRRRLAMHREALKLWHVSG
jgi:hypothetical protein